MSARLASDPNLAGLKVTLTIHAANGLIAKDRNIFGKVSQHESNRLAPLVLALLVSLYVKYVIYYAVHCTSMSRDGALIYCAAHNMIADLFDVYTSASNREHHLTPM